MKVMFAAVSPELVLVDPELARAERARMVEEARVAELPAAVEALVPPASLPIVDDRLDLSALRRKATLVAIAGAAAALGFAAGRADAPLVESRTAMLPQPAISAAPAPPAVRTLAAKGRAERLLLTSIYRAKPQRIPRALLDGTTGFPKNNLQAVCHQTNEVGLFRCAVGVAGESLRQGALVRYGDQSGTAAVSWRSLVSSRSTGGS
jgi:hypothetical protein